MKIYTDRVRVMMNSKYTDIEEINKMVGKEFDVKTNSHFDKAVAVSTKDESDYYWFNETDVRYLTPLKFEGNSIAIGDYVEKSNVKGIVTSFIVYDGVNRIVIEDEEYGTRDISERSITAHNTELNETIEVNGKKYNKEEVESKLSELKEIK